MYNLLRQISLRIPTNMSKFSHSSNLNLKFTNKIFNYIKTFNLDKKFNFDIILAYIGSFYFLQLKTDLTRA